MTSNSSYYQLAIPKDDIRRITTEASSVGLNSIPLNSFIAFQLRPEDLNNFDEKTARLRIRYMMIKNIDFFKILEKSDSIDLEITRIWTEHIEDQNIEEEIEECVKAKNYKKLESIINSNHIIIKSLECKIGKTHLIFYESGIFWVDDELSKIKNFFEFITNIFTQR